MNFFKPRAYVGLLAVYFIFLFTAQAVGSDTSKKAEGLAATPSHYFAATYFHTTTRCPTCRKIEALSRKAITVNFADELKNGTLFWRAVNVDEPEHHHYKNDYQLFTKSLILSEIKDGKELRWKNLQKIWQLVGDEKAFKQYVLSEINAWLVVK